MLMKIGDVTGKFGISHRSLHYWESVGILQSSRGSNDYRYYNEENLKKIQQIVLLRKLRLSIPSIQEIFQSEDLTKIAAVFTAHLDETAKEKKQLDALGKVLRQLINMLRDRQDIDSMYRYLSANHSAETEELKAALQTVLAEPVKESAEEAPLEPIVDMTGVDLSLELMSEQDIPAVTQVIKRCYARLKPKDMGNLLRCWDFNSLHMPDCRWLYRIMQNGTCVGAVNLVDVGMEAMLIRSLAYDDPGNNVYLFEVLKQKHPDVLCWNIYFPNEKEEAKFHFDFEGQKHRFGDDNGFVYYTNARWNRYIKMLKPHDEVYNSSRYRFALLDGSMDGTAFRFFGVDRFDFYDGRMTNWRINDCYFAEALIYDTCMSRSRFYDSTMEGCDFRYSNLRNCAIIGCEIQGMTIDGISVEEALKLYREK